jgi:predicted nucleic acid-binding protein
VNVVDSSGWLEYFADGPNAENFAGPLRETQALVVPTICLTEVFKVVARQRGEPDALQAVALMQQGSIVDLDRDIAVLAARAGILYKLPLADSIVLATGRAMNAEIWTQDEDFEGLEGVRYFPKIR